MNSSIATFGSTITFRMRVSRLISISCCGAPASARRCGPWSVSTTRPSSCSSSSARSLRHQVDHLQLERLLGGGRDRLAHRLLRPLDVALALLRDRLDEGGHQVLGLLVGAPSGLPSSPSPPGAAAADPTGCAAPMLEPGAIAATCPASVMKVPAEPAQAPCGATYTTMGTREASIAWMMSLRGGDQAARRVELDQQDHGASARGLLDRALEVVGRGRVDRAVDARDRDRPAPLRRRALRRAERGEPRARAPARRERSPATLARIVARSSQLLDAVPDARRDLALVEQRQLLHLAVGREQRHRVAVATRSRRRCATRRSRRAGRSPCAPACGARRRSRRGSRRRSPPRCARRARG